MGVKAQRAAATRTGLVSAARELFAAEGYGATSTEAILAAAGVTRGALYHHFADKQALFAAVCEDLHGEAERVIETDADAQASAFDGLVAGCLGFLDFMADPQVRRILILDAPSVLGWEAWNEMDRRHGFGLLIEGVRAAVVEGSLEGDPEALAVMINGALNYGVVWAGHTEGPEALARLKSSFVETLVRLRR
ncbi:TetR/AcrR family transcriptional regulator [Phenylobacterium sp.]|uniref:TetR/AcrR family transcriptional regulator n=1 Tax=Phenylobacterium sp. TaxID=1871053 RepID=UPI0025D5F1F5|nr:TetR/AcrR family transcriptional regulator [Phenylobacterium sp.]